MENDKRTIEEVIAELKELKEKSTPVVAWYDHGETVRGPFGRWFRIEQPEQEIQHDKVVRAHGFNDAAYCAAALNQVPRLITEIERLKRSVD